jgi:hypothetical protein
LSAIGNVLSVEVLLDGSRVIEIQTRDGDHPRSLIPRGILQLGSVTV